MFGLTVLKKHLLSLDLTEYSLDRRILKGNDKNTVYIQNTPIDTLFAKPYASVSNTNYTPYVHTHHKYPSCFGWIKISDLRCLIRCTGGNET